MGHLPDCQFLGFPPGIPEKDSLSERTARTLVIMLGRPKLPLLPVIVLQKNDIVSQKSSKIFFIDIPKTTKEYFEFIGEIA
jgi:hypothetical protein